MRTEETIINVIFDADRGSVSVAAREAVVGQPLGALPRPTRTGYRFEGWYLGDTPVNAETVLESDSDVELVARWTRVKGGQKTSMYKKQKTAVVVLSVLTVVLIVALLFVNHIVAIYGLVDTYYTEDGEVCTEKYYVRKKGGVYGLYDRSGKKMEMNADGYYLAHSGNQYEVDAQTGEYELYAVVDFDAEGGELLGYRDRIMMFPQITQTNTYSIEVTNEYGSYTFYRQKDGTVRLKGTEDTLALYNPELFASLCNACGYTLTMQKLDLTSDKSNAPKLEDGSIDYEAYGLVERYDEEGNVVYKPAKYTITKAIYADDGTCTPDPDEVYTVIVGDAILSKGGYYVQLEGRGAVYIVTTAVQETVLQPVEALVTPMIAYPTTVATHAMVVNFLLGRLDLTELPENSEDLDEELIKPIAAFSYQDLEERLYTIYASTPYISQMDLLKGYEINDDNATEVLTSIYQMQFVACKKLGITKDALKAYNLDGDVHYLAFSSPVLDEKNSIKGYVDNTLLISPKTENSTYYIASIQYDMIVEVDQYYLSFLDWEQNEWYNKLFFGPNTAHIKELHLQIGDKSFDFTFDNSESDQSKGESSAKLKVFCEQFTGGKADPHLLDYNISYSYITDKGTEKVVNLSGLDNFARLYDTLLYFTLEGDVNPAEFEAVKGMTIEEFIAQSDKIKCDGMLAFKTEDNAVEMNDFTYTDKDGNEVKLYTKNNTQNLVYRFYRYSDRKALITVEVVEESGQPDPTHAVGVFYVLSDYLNVILEDAEAVIAAKPVNPEG